MSLLLQPCHILLAALCGMVNERQQKIIEFQNAQIETLLKKLGKKRLLLDDNQRRLVAVNFCLWQRAACPSGEFVGGVIRQSSAPARV